MKASRLLGEFCLLINKIGVKSQSPARFILVGIFPKFTRMENAASPLDEKLQILKRIEDIGNRDFDGVDVTKLLKEYLHSTDDEIILSSSASLP